jgi:hypothetical protein
VPQLLTKRTNLALYELRFVVKIVLKVVTTLIETAFPSPKPKLEIKVSEFHIISVKDSNAQMTFIVQFIR